VVNQLPQGIAVTEDKVIIYGIGTYYLYVCVDDDVSPSAMLQVANLRHPAATARGWRIADAPFFNGDRILARATAITIPTIVLTFYLGVDEYGLQLTTTCETSRVVCNLCTRTGTRYSSRAQAENHTLEAHPVEHYNHVKSSPPPTLKEIAAQLFRDKYEDGYYGTPPMLPDTLL
jgi:hypothetical protein